jgi:hypothetical protein
MVDKTNFLIHILGMIVGHKIYFDELLNKLMDKVMSSGEFYIQEETMNTPTIVISKNDNHYLTTAEPGYEVRIFHDWGEVTEYAIKFLDMQPAKEQWPNSPAWVGDLIKEG